MRTCGSGLFVVAAFASCSVFDATFLHQMSASSMQSSDAVDGGSLASRKVKPWKFGGRVRDKILPSGVCQSPLYYPPLFLCAVKEGGCLDAERPSRSEPLRWFYVEVVPY